jgi:O-antigen/teichoic acid export membrane protein
VELKAKTIYSNQVERFTGLLRNPVSIAIANLSPRVMMLITFVGMSAINYAFGFAAAWLLAPGDFGLLAFSQTILTMTALVLNSGFTWSLAAALVGAGGEHRARLVRGTGLGNFLLALLMGLAILAFYAIGPLKPGLETWHIALLVAGSLPLLALVATARATLQGSECFGAFASLWLIETVTKATAGIGLVIAGYGVVGAVAGFFIGSLLASLFGLFILFKKFRITPFGARQGLSFQKTSAMFSALLGMALLLNMDTLALKLFSFGDRAIVGYYQAGIILANIPYYMMTAMFPVIFTQIVRKKTIRDSAVVVGDTFRLALIVMVPVEALLALFPQTFLHLLFPAAYLAGAPALRLLALGNTAIILVAVLSTVFQGVGSASTAGRTLIGVAVIEAVLLGMAVPKWHSAGASALFLVATSTTLLILGIRYLAQLDHSTVQAGFHWFGKYCITVIMSIFAGGLILALFKNDWFAIVTGGSTFLLGLQWFGLFSISSLGKKIVDLRARQNVKVEEG